MWIPLTKEICDRTQNLEVLDFALSAMVYRSGGFVHQLLKFRIGKARPLRLGRTAKQVIPDVHFGVVLSGNKVIADEETSGALKSVWVRAAAIEMEAAGVGAAIAQDPRAVAFVMSKAISDRADAKKDDRSQA